MIDRAREPEVLFHRRASHEYLRARRWYAKHGGEQLAKRFTAAVEEAVQRVIDSPDRWPKFRDEYRWVRLHRFPYLLYYHRVDVPRIVILAVAHSGRRPGYWLRRSKD
jgi:plasmid stabilization system protein ParE